MPSLQNSGQSGPASLCYSSLYEWHLLFLSAVMAMSTFPESFFLAPNATKEVASASLPSISGRSCLVCTTNLEEY